MRLQLKSKINLFGKAALCGFLFIACACSTYDQTRSSFEKTDAAYHQQKEVIPKGWEFAPAYLEGLKKASSPKEIGVLLEGQLPTACNQLWVSGAIQNDTLTLSIQSIRNRQEACTMALEAFSVFVPFSYFDISDQKLASIRVITAQDISISLK
jgi:hypothetical protein